jgi:predicted nucleotidyltransferase
MHPSIHISKDALKAFCVKHHIARLAIFGSALGAGFGPGSDLDVVVEFELGYLPGLAFFAMEEELSGLVGCKVDLNTPEFLSPSFRDQVLQGAEVAYAS